MILYDYKNNDWQDISVLQRNRLSTRPFYCAWETPEKALGGDKNTSPNYTCLNGKWDFAFYDSPMLVPKDINKTSFNKDIFSSINVPAHWQFEGYGTPSYTDNISLIPTTAEHIIQYENPTGVYRRFVSIEKDTGIEYILRFDGVESAFHLYVNGENVGYSQVSRCTSEFDVSAYLKTGENLVTVIVYQFCDGSALEKQDMWTLAGIIRDVALITRPTVHISDYTLQAGLNPTNWTEGIFKLSAKIDNNSFFDSTVSVDAIVLQDGKELFRIDASENVSKNADKEFVLQTSAGSVKAWSAETPYLYSLLIVLQVNGMPPQYHHQKFGYRDIRINNGLIEVNGKYVTFRGMNRHDWSGESGRCVNLQEMKKDLLLMKSYNINAVRTAHYPNMPVFYEMCDKLGMYVVSEADLECNQTEYFEDSNTISDGVEWKESYLDRTERMVRRDKNFTCIIIWSLGNESGYGRNFQACYNFCKEYDPTRLVHYEEDKEALSADMYSTMYTKHDALEKLGQQTQLTKPHILCEYGHALGNSTGGLEEYLNIINKYPRLQGGFIWEWIAHGIQSVDQDNRLYYKYGGDFGDKPTSGKFCTSGMISPNRTPFPGVWQLKKAYEPVKLDFNAESETLSIHNLFSFLPLDIFYLDCSILEDGNEIEHFKHEIPAVPPLSSQSIPFPIKNTWKQPDGKEKILTLNILYKEKPIWGNEEEGEKLSCTQFTLSPVTKLLPFVKKQVQTYKDERFFTVSSGELRAVFDMAAAKLYSVEYLGRQVLAHPMDLCFWRAPIDNDKNQILIWEKFLVSTIKNCPLKVEWVDETLVMRKVFAPITKEWRIDTTLKFRIANDCIRIDVEGTPSGILPPTLPRTGAKFAIPTSYTDVRWHGRGPQPNYPDSKLGTALGIYKKSIKKMHTSFVVPQENGARCDIRQIEFTGKDINPLTIKTQPHMMFSAQKYSDDSLEKALHINELESDDVVWVHLDHNQHGLGSAGWGPEALENTTLHPKKFEFSFEIQLSTSYL